MKLYILIFYLLSIATLRGSTYCIDMLACGDATSEREHNLNASFSEIIVNPYGTSHRRLLSNGKGWLGGTMSVTLRVDPARQNYITARFWGSEANSNRLVLFHEKKQIGYHHIGDYEVFDIGNTAPFRPNQFYYVTSPLPLSITKGKSLVRLDLQATGPINHMATDHKSIPQSMRGASRNIYNIYIHTDEAFDPEPNANQNSPKAIARLRPASKENLVDRIVARVNADIHTILSKKGPPSIEEMY